MCELAWYQYVLMALGVLVCIVALACIAMHISEQREASARHDRISNKFFNQSCEIGIHRFYNHNELCDKLIQQDNRYTQLTDAVRILRQEIATLESMLNKSKKK